MSSIIKVQNIQYTDGDAALTIADGGGVTAASTLTVNNNLSSVKSTGGNVNLTTNAQAGSSGSPLNMDINFKGYNNNTMATIRSHDESSSTGHGELQFHTNKNGVGFREVVNIDHDGNLDVKLGNVKIGTSGKGIDFSATSDGSGANQSELLDDYEEGTWTATMPVGGSVSVSSSYYVKVGAMVYAGAYITCSGQTNNGALWRIGGLPYAVKTGSHYHAAGSITYSHNTNTNNFMSPTPYSGGGSELYFHRNDGTSTAITGSQAQSIDYLIFALVYITDS